MAAGPVEGDREVTVLVGQRRLEQGLALGADIGPGGLEHAGGVVDVDVAALGQGPQAVLRPSSPTFGALTGGDIDSGMIR